MPRLRRTTCAEDLAAAVRGFLTASDGPSGDAEYDAALELADRAEELLATRTVRVSDLCSRAMLTLRARTRRRGAGRC